MVYKSFHLLGKDPSVHTNVHMVEIDITHDLEAAKVHVADSFSIVVPSGVSFQTSKSESITDLDTLLDADQPIAVTVDGHAIRPVPGPRGLPIVGSYYEIYPDHMGNNQRLFEKLGSVIQHTDTGNTTYLTRDPAVANQILQENPFWSKLINDSHPLIGGKSNESGLFFCDTDTRAWRLAHKFLPPALSPKAVRKYTPMMQRTAESTFATFDHFADQDEVFDVFAYMFKLTSQAVAKLVLNMDLHHFDSVDAPLSPMVSNLMELLALVKKVGSKGAWYAHLPWGDPKRLRNVQSDFLASVGKSLQEARAHAGGDLPIATAALEAESIADFAARAVDEEGNKLPEDVLLSSVPIIVGAGFITTATLMSWMVHCCTSYPEVQEKLVQELVDHGVDADTQWTFDTTNDLPYLDKFIKETQRLFNPAYQPARTAMRDQIIPGGYEIPKGAVMIAALHAIHRNPATWDDPTTFNPDRWDSDKVRSRPAGSYIPFATGPRSCIGFNFALQEAKTVFSTLLYRYEFVKYNDENIDYDPESTVFMPTNLYVRIRRRTSWPKKSA